MALRGHTRRSPFRESAPEQRVRCGLRLHSPNDWSALRHSQRLADRPHSGETGRVAPVAAPQGRIKGFVGSQDCARTAPTHVVTLASIAGKLRDDGLNADEMEPVLIRHVEEFFDDYGSDYQEMARKVARSIGKKEAGFAGPTVLIVGKLPGEAPTKLIVAAAAEAKSDSWPPVTPLENKLSPVAVFKPEFLPDSIRPWVVDVSERMSVPLDFAGICALVTVAGVLGRRVFVCPKAKDKDWKESIALSGAVVADSGKAKTPTWKTFTNVVVEKEADWNNEYKERIAKFTEELESWEALDKANKELEKKSGVAQNTPRSGRTGAFSLSVVE